MCRRSLSMRVPQSASVPKARPRVLANAPLVEADRAQVKLLKTQTAKADGEPELRQGSAVALAPACLLADHDAVLGLLLQKSMLNSEVSPIVRQLARS